MLWPFTSIIGPSCACSLQAPPDLPRVAFLDTLPFRRYTTQRVDKLHGNSFFYDHSYTAAFKLWVVLRRGVDSRTSVSWELRSFELNAKRWNHTLSSTFGDSWRATMVTWTWGVSHIESSIRPSTYSTMTAGRPTPASHTVYPHQSLFPGPNKSAEIHDPHLSKHLIVLHSQNTGLTCYVLPAPTQSKAAIYKKIYYTTYLHGEKKGTATSRTTNR